MKTLSYSRICETDLDIVSHFRGWAGPNKNWQCTDSLTLPYERLNADIFAPPSTSSNTTETTEYRKTLCIRTFFFLNQIQTECLNNTNEVMVPVKMLSVFLSRKRRPLIGLVIYVIVVSHREIIRITLDKLRLITCLINNDTIRAAGL